MSVFRFLPWLTVPAALMLPATLFGAAPTSPDVRPGPPSLAGQFLIATPGMRDPRFQSTVLVMIRHDRDGAMAIVINRPAGDETFSRLLEAVGEESTGVSGRVPIFAGGPVQPELGFVLHSTDYRRAETRDINGDVAMTSTPKIFRDIAMGSGPKKSMVAFGYAGWAPGQLESELARNAWYTAPLDSKLVFDADRDGLWELAVERRTRDL